MENQHRKITGYRELSQGEIDLMNRIKEQGVVLKNLIEDVHLHVSDQFGNLDPAHEDDELKRLLAANPLGWLQHAQHTLQSGLMELTRAVAQPTTF